MLDGQGCLLPVLHAHLREGEKSLVLQLFLQTQICRSEVVQCLHRVRSRCGAEKPRKRPKRFKVKTSQICGVSVKSGPFKDSRSLGKAVVTRSLEKASPGDAPSEEGAQSDADREEEEAADSQADVHNEASSRDNDPAAESSCSNGDEEGAGKTEEKGEVVDTSYLPGLDDSAALRCLAFVPVTEHWRLAMLSQRHRDLVRSSLLLTLRREYKQVQQWICIYTSGNNVWTAFDPKQNVWRNLPRANVDPSFDLCDKESLSAGSHLLWLGREALDFACYRYDLLSNSWGRGPPMVNPRCLFASASYGRYAFVAGGFTAGGMQFNVLNTAEKYDSIKGVWQALPPMSTPRHKCSGFVMDGKFYVIGGKSTNHEPLTSGEEYDPEKNAWRTIENMYSTPPSVPTFEPSPPLVAVAGNELYAIESSSNLLKVYQKQRNTWKVLGPVPVRADFCNGWGLALKALGNELFVIGGHRVANEEREGVAVFSWKPRPGDSAPEWQLVNSRVTGTGNFLFNCAVMAC